VVCFSIIILLDYNELKFFPYIETKRQVVKIIKQLALNY